MGLFDQFPYTNFHELNLDWILQALKELEHTIDQFVSINALKYADPIQWNITSQYEKNTIVIDPLTGTAYISVQPVPTGVAITNSNYWTVVFDLGSFVTRAAKNFTDRWESEWTQTATFPSNTGDWLVWNDTLYKALVNITAGDTYVIGSNIEHFTIEDLYNTYINTIAQIYDQFGYNEADNVTAAYAHNAGSYIIWNGILYEVINAIAVGDTLEIGTNLQHVTIDYVFRTLKSDLSNEITNRSNADKLIYDQFGYSEADNVTAAYAHNAGSYIIWNGIFYEVTTSIAVGDTLEVGTNLQHVTIDYVFRTLKSNLSNEITNRTNADKLIYDQFGYNESNNVTAAYAHNAGSYIIWNGIFYEVTTSIAVGDTLEIGTNLQHITIDAEFRRLSKEIAATNVLFNKKIAVFGDSISDENSTATTQPCWVSLMRTALDGIATVDNYSVSGRKMIDLPTTLPGSSVLSAYDIAIVALGVNDFSNDVPFAQRYDYSTDYTTYFNEAVLRVWTLIRNANPEMEIYFVTPFYAKSANHKYSMQAYRACLLGWAQGWNCKIINGEHVNGINYQSTSNLGWYNDNIHPNTPANKAIAKHILKALIRGGDGYDENEALVTDLTPNANFTGNVQYYFKGTELVFKIDGVVADTATITNVTNIVDLTNIVPIFNTFYGSGNIWECCQAFDTTDSKFVPMAIGIVSNNIVVRGNADAGAIVGHAYNIHTYLRIRPSFCNVNSIY